MRYEVEQEALNVHTDLEELAARTQRKISWNVWMYLDNYVWLQSPAHQSERLLRNPRPSPAD